MSPHPTNPPSSSQRQPKHALDGHVEAPKTKRRKVQESGVKVDELDAEYAKFMAELERVDVAVPALTPVKAGDGLVMGIQKGGIESATGEEIVGEAVDDIVEYEEIAREKIRRLRDRRSAARSAAASAQLLKKANVAMAHDDEEEDSDDIEEDSDWRKKGI